jgi:hypothetical protein
MPRIEGQPGEQLREVWVYLSESEAHELLAALVEWADEGASDPEWHCHIGSLPAGELTIAVEH